MKRSPSAATGPLTPVTENFRKEFASSRFLNARSVVAPPAVWLAKLDRTYASSVGVNVATGREAYLSGRNPIRHLWSSPAESRDVAEATSAALDLCGITAISDLRVADLSTGQRRLFEDSPPPEHEEPPR
jgi:hypothetical protein